MALSRERQLEIFNLLRVELATVLQDGIQVALQQSIVATGLVRELESHGFRLTTTFDYSLCATPVEMEFDRGLTEIDRRILRRLLVRPPDSDDSLDRKS